MMKKMFHKTLAVAVTLILSAGILFTSEAFAQKQSPRPDTVVDRAPKTYVGEGVKNGIGVNLLINNFGFGVGGEYRRFISPYSDITITLDITGVRNVSEQSFQTIFGQQIIPNKYNRVLAFPLRIGMRHRFFANQITDNFRVHLSGQVGPALTFIYPYFPDTNNNGFRDTGPPFPTYEPPNDFFTGWSDGEFELGLSGELMVSFDFGEKFDRLTSVEFGFYFYYYPQGIQIMEPRKPVINDQGQIVYENGSIDVVTEPFYGEQNYLGTPQITFTFGNLW